MNERNEQQPQADRRWNPRPDQIPLQKIDKNSTTKKKFLCVFQKLEKSVALLFMLPFLLTSYDGEFRISSTWSVHKLCEYFTSFLSSFRVIDCLYDLVSTNAHAIAIKGNNSNRQRDSATRAATGDTATNAPAMTTGDRVRGELESMGIVLDCLWRTGRQATACLALLETCACRKGPKSSGRRLLLSSDHPVFVVCL